MDLLFTLLNDELLAAIAHTLLHFLWQGAAIAAVLFALLTWYTQSSHARYWLALSALALMAVCPFITFFMVFEGASVETSSTPFVAGSFTVVLVEDVLASHGSDLGLAAIALGWLAGVLYLSSRLVLETLDVYRLPYRATQPVPIALQSLFDDIRLKLKILVPVKLLVSEHIDVPMVIGWLRPFVLLPVSMTTGLSERQLSMLLAHELAHVKRFDFAVNFLQTLVEIMLFFHPCVKWVSEQIRIDREHCCDDSAISLCGDHHAYARTLVEAESVRQHSIPQLAMAATAGDLKSRVLRIVGNIECTNYRGINTISAMFAGLTGIALLVAVTFYDDITQYRDQKNNEQVAKSPAEPPVDKTPTPTPTPINNVEPLPQVETSIPNVQDDDSNLVAVAQPSQNDAQSSNPEPIAADDTVASNVETADSASVEEISSASIEEQVEEIDSDLSTPSALSALNASVVDRSSEQAAKPPVIETPLSKSLSESVAETSVAPEPVATEVVAQDNVQQEQIVEAVLSTNDNKAGVIAKATPAVKAKPAPKKLVKEPRLVRSRKPNYPWHSITSIDEAEVRVSFTVNTKGRVQDLIFENSPNKSFKREVKRVLKSWRFEPGSVDGKLTAMQMKKIFSFSDSAGDASASSQALIGTRLMQ